MAVSQLYVWKSYVAKTGQIHGKNLNSLTKAADKVQWQEKCVQREKQKKCKIVLMSFLGQKTRSDDRLHYKDFQHDSYVLNLFTPMSQFYHPFRGFGNGTLVWQGLLSAFKGIKTDGNESFARFRLFDTVKLRKIRQTNTCSKSTIEILTKGMKYVQSL